MLQGSANGVPTCTGKPNSSKWSQEAADKLQESVDRIFGKGGDRGERTHGWGWEALLDRYKYVVYTNIHIIHSIQVKYVVYTIIQIQIDNYTNISSFLFSFVIQNSLLSSCL